MLSQISSGISALGACLRQGLALIAQAAKNGFALIVCKAELGFPEWVPMQVPFDANAPLVRKILFNMMTKVNASTSSTRADVNNRFADVSTLDIVLTTLAKMPVLRNTGECQRDFFGFHGRGSYYIGVSG